MRILQSVAASTRLSAPIHTSWFACEGFGPRLDLHQPGGPRSHRTRLQRGNGSASARSAWVSAGSPGTRVIPRSSAPLAPAGSFVFSRTRAS